MEFKNIGNECIEATDGRKFWISRSVACLMTVCIVKYGIPYFLIHKRGPGAADNNGLYALSGGYLDWSESSWAGAVRELFEETGINAFDIMEKNRGRNVIEPWKVISDPDKDHKQNINIHHYVLCDNWLNDLPEPKITNYDEVSEVRWISLYEIDKYDYAFKHNEIIKEFCKKFELVK